MKTEALLTAAKVAELIGMGAVAAILGWILGWALVDLLWRLP